MQGQAAHPPAIQPRITLNAGPDPGFTKLDNIFKIKIKEPFHSSCRSSCPPACNTAQNCTQCGPGSRPSRNWIISSQTKKEPFCSSNRASRPVPARLQYSQNCTQYLSNQNKRTISFIMQGKLPPPPQYSPKLRSMRALVQASRNWIISFKSK